MTFATHLAPCHACRCPAYLSVRVASRPNLGVFTPVTPEWHRLLHAAATHDTVARRSTLVARSETMKLQGSCHCGKVKFTFETKTPQPFMHCYCSICRKTQGGSGSCINIMGESETFEATGTENLSIYRAPMEQHKLDGELAGNMRHFCKTCGSHLWAWCPKYPTSIYPVASAIDTPLPVPVQRSHIMTGSKPEWIIVPPQQAANGERDFVNYPDEGIEQWHKKHKLSV